MDPMVLAQVLRPLKNLFPTDRYPHLLLGLEVSDDAAVYKITDDLAVIQTLDFFTPIVDDPYDYGAIAAANAMSDIYAMGGEVTVCMNICGFPPDLPQAIVAEILRGGAEKVAEAGAAMVGGHTVYDKEPKYGLSVMGLIHPDNLLSKAGARPNDRLILTKALGVGIIATALKADVAKPEHIAPAVESMKQLNRRAIQLIQGLDVHACTDITGFSLLGHASEIAEKSGVQLRLKLDQIPILSGVRQYAQERLFPGGSCRNQTCYKSVVHFARDISKETQLLLFTPETSGGLLLCVPPEQVDALRSRFIEADHFYAEVGDVAEGAGIQVS